MPNPYDALKLDRQLCFPLYVVSKEIIRRYKPLLDPFGLTYTQYIAMMALWENDGISVSALGEKLYLDSGTLTPLLKKMEAAGWITRTRDHKNERTVRLRVTREGLELRDHVLHVPHEIIKNTSMTQTELQTLYRLLHKYIDEHLDK